MTSDIFLFLCGIYLSFVSVVKVQTYNYRSNQNFRYDSDQRGKSYFSLDAELHHAIHDDRCRDNNLLIQESIKTTNFGVVRGRRVYLCDGPGVELRNRPQQDEAFSDYKAVNVFLGIPYAKPPTKQNNLQLKPPQLPERWSEISATNYKPSCPQNRKYLGIEKGMNNTDEDCLYLNIFAPDASRVQKQNPVMIYIHGGNWDHGSANVFPGHMLAASQDVVVVTFNYRLGHLGFLSTADSASVGNYGVLDQVQAVRWVYENIDIFGGDSQTITLFGTGAGAIAASLLAISPMSRSMVKRVIAQNGAPVADWAAIVDPLFMFNTSRILGVELGCTTEDSFRLVECVGKRSNNEIRILEMKPRVGWLPWGPVVDNFTKTGDEHFLPESPAEMLEKGVPFADGFAYMTGVNKNQGVSILLDDPYLEKLQYRMTEDVFNKKVGDFMNMYNYSINANGIFNAINFMYKPPTDSTNMTLLRQGYIDLLTDRYYTSPSNRMGHLLVKKGVPTYMYVLNYTFEGYRPKNPWEGVTSETEYLLLTGAPFMNPKFYPTYLNLKSARWTEADRNMSQFMLEAWANFARKGNATPTRLFNTIFWEHASERNFVHLNLSSTKSTATMIPDYKEKESEFWNCFLPFLIDREPPTLAPTLEPGLDELRVVTGALWGSVAAAALFLIITLVCCILYCRIRRKQSYSEDLTSSREVIVKPSTSHQDTLV